MRASRKLPTFRTAIARLRADARGVSIIEFALFLPVLAFMVMGTVDVGRAIAHKFALEQGAQRAIELAALGNAQEDYESLRADAATAAGVPITNVELTQWVECNGVKQATFSTVCPEGQVVARYVVVRLFNDFSPSFSWGPLGSAFGQRQANGSVRIAVDSGVRVQ